MGVKRPLLALVLLVLIACTAGCRNVRTARSVPVPPPPDITVLGTVAEVSPNARLIVLAEPVEGFTLLVLASGGQVLSADGHQLSLQELAPGLQIQASGQPGGSGGLLVSSVHLVDPNRPAPTVQPIRSDGITVELPRSGASIVSPVQVRGQIEILPLEHVVQVRVCDTQGQVIGEAPATVNSAADGPASFVAHVTFAALSGSPGQVVVVQIDPADGTIVASASVDIVLPGSQGSTSTTTIVGRVAEISLSPPLLVMSETAAGFGFVALAGGGVVRASTGAEISLEAVRPGASVQASGYPGDADTLIADSVVVLEEGGTPVAQPPAAPKVEIVLDSPVPGATVSSPIEVRGQVSVTPPEARLRVRVYDESNQVIGEAPLTVAGTPGGPGTFNAKVSLTSTRGGSARVEVAQLSATDDSFLTSSTVDIAVLAQSETTITAVVAEVLPGARIVHLSDLVEGYTVVALTAQTRIVDGNGTEVTLPYIQSGTRIEASGHSGSSGVLIADWIRLL